MDGGHLRHSRSLEGGTDTSMPLFSPGPLPFTLLSYIRKPCDSPCSQVLLDTAGIRGRSGFEGGDTPVSRELCRLWRWSSIGS